MRRHARRVSPWSRCPLPVTAIFGHVAGTTVALATIAAAGTAPDLRLLSGDDGTRTHDPLLAKQVL